LELNEHSDAKGNPYGQNKTKIEENIWAMWLSKVQKTREK
jgi:hypothetical protein